MQSKLSSESVKTDSITGVRLTIMPNKLIVKRPNVKTPLVWQNQSCDFHPHHMELI